MTIAGQCPFSEVQQFDQLDSRISAIDCLFANIIGVNDDSVEWCPNDDPPSREEYLAWVWVVRPSLGTQIQEECGTELSKLIQHYDSQKMELWFEYVTT